MRLERVTFLRIIQPGVVAIKPATLLMLSGTIGYAISIITTRFISREDSALIIVFYMVLLQALFALPPAIYAWQLPGGQQWLFLVVTALAGLGAHYCLASALSLADAAVVMPIDYLRMPLISIIAWVLYHEVLTLPLIIGAALIIAGNAVGLYGEKLKNKHLVSVND